MSMKASRILNKTSLFPGVPPVLPVVQASLGLCDGPRLAAAVSRAGGLGTLSVRNPAPAALRLRLRQIRAVTPRPVLLAFTAQWERDAVFDTAIAEGFRAFQVFWWNAPRLISRIRQAGGTVFCQVGTREEARDAIETGASVLIAQGTEAGGQVRSPRPVLELVRDLRDTFGSDIPIIAGGGFADAADGQAALAAGANAALFGTRFLLSEEANAATRDKARLLKASQADLRLDTRMIGDWPCAPRRCLYSRTNEDRPGLYAGLGVGRIQTLLPAADLVRRLAKAGATDAAAPTAASTDYTGGGS
ncbi:MAG: nitronate monooxygenase [Akkermansiaceae bacterium]|nr:nitronate monooxygenase [Armatimonadota bacterium]